MGTRKGGNGVEKDCGGWISLLFHKLRKRVNADVQDAGAYGHPRAARSTTYSSRALKGRFISATWKACSA